MIVSIARWSRVIGQWMNNAPQSPKARYQIPLYYILSFSLNKKMNHKAANKNFNRRQHRETIAKPSTHVCLFWVRANLLDTKYSRVSRIIQESAIERTKRAATFSIRLHARAPNIPNYPWNVFHGWWWHLRHFEWLWISVVRLTTDSKFIENSHGDLDF